MPFHENADIVDSINFSDTVRYKTLKGKIVYGGGGIMPDIYIPFKSEFISDYYRKIINKGIIAEFAFDFADRSRKMLKGFNNAENYISKFQISDQLLNDLVLFAEKKGIPKDEEGIKMAGTNLKALLKGSIGRNIFDDPAFYPVILNDDVTFKKAIEVLNLK